MSSAAIVAKILALGLAVIAVAALAAYARDNGKSVRHPAPACCIYLIF
jgi:hypothetical protein